MTRAIDFLKANMSETPSKWREEAEFRRKNRKWIRYSQWIALKVLERMEELKITQKVLAEKLGCSQQYVSLLVKGSENLTLETIAKLEDVLNTQILFSASPWVDGYYMEPAKPQYLSEPDSPEYGGDDSKEY